MTPLVEAVDVTRQYRLGRGPDAVVVEALRGVSFAVGEGEFVAIVGPSGSGKSTLLHLLGALDRPTTGSLRFSGRDVADMDDGDLAELRNREIGFVFQQFQLLNRTSALSNVALPLVYRGASRAERRELAGAALASVGLSHRLTHRPAQLSGGEQQRVAVARAVAGSPSILLADEPTGNLDSKNGEAVMELLRELHREGATICMVTHDPRYARHADRSIHLFDGRVVEEDGSKRAEKELEESGFHIEH